MAVSLNKGDKVALSKDSIVTKISVCLGWDIARYDDDGDFDLDASAFVITKTGMTRCDEDFIFYNNLKHPSGGIEHSGDNLTGSGSGDENILKSVKYGINKINVGCDFMNANTEAIKKHLAADPDINFWSNILSSKLLPASSRCSGYYGQNGSYVSYACWCISCNHY